MKEWLILLISSFLLGCSTIPDTYKPETIGFVVPGNSFENVSVFIETSQRNVPIGDYIIFNCRIKNENDYPVIIPSHPDLRFHFTYANGRRDNYLNDFKKGSYFFPYSVTALKPDGEINLKVLVETYYFTRRGITEFYCVMDIPDNLNPDIDVWRGRVKSNSFGVNIIPSP